MLLPRTPSGQALQAKASPTALPELPARHPAPPSVGTPRVIIRKLGIILAETTEHFQRGSGPVPSIR